MNNETLLQRLSEPFPPDAITWKPGSTTKDGNKCMAMPYGDLRAYLNRLDELCGLDWAIAYEPWGTDRIIARLTIGGITRCSTGEMGSQDIKNEMGGTVAEAQAFKRAAAMFGLGRYLYEMPNAWVEFDPARKRITDGGQRELEQRYKVWYAKTMAQAQVAPLTQVNEAPVDNPFIDVDFTNADANSPHQKLWAAGLKCFHDDWDMARPWLIGRWTKHVTPDKIRSSAADLSDKEKGLLATYLNDKCSDLRKVWPRQKAMMLQTTN